MQRKYSPFRLVVSMHILHTVLYTLVKELTNRSCLTIKNQKFILLVSDHFLHSRRLNI